MPGQMITALGCQTRRGIALHVSVLHFDMNTSLYD